MKQPEALVLASLLEESDRPWSKGTAAELRRLHELELAHKEWITKTDWMKATCFELGMHKADALRQRIDLSHAEIRRLHKENERLLAANRDSTNHFDALMADHKKLQGVNGELLAALEYCAGSSYITDVHEVATEALAKAKGETE